jgi:hypothetical protein
VVGASLVEDLGRHSKDYEDTVGAIIDSHRKREKIEADGSALEVLYLNKLPSIDTELQGDVH